MPTTRVEKRSRADDTAPTGVDGTAPPDSVEGRLPVVLVCCGAPKLSMGWFHLTQLVQDPTVELRAVVEPFLLGAGKESTAGKAFATLRSSLSESHPDLQFYSSVSEVTMGLQPSTTYLPCHARLHHPFHLCRALC